MSLSLLEKVHEGAVVEISNMLPTEAQLLLLALTLIGEEEIDYYQVEEINFYKGCDNRLENNLFLESQKGCVSIERRETLKETLVVTPEQLVSLLMYVVKNKGN